MVSRLFFLVLVAIVAGGSAAFVQYGSLDPCDWVLPALANKIGVPEAMISAYTESIGATVGDVRAAIRDQSPAECFSSWLDIQTEDFAEIREKAHPG